MRYEKKIVFIATIIAVLIMFGGCKESVKTVETAVVQEDTTTVISEEPLTQATVSEDIPLEEEIIQVSSEVGELYLNQALMLEALVNESCVIQESGDGLTITTPDSLGYIGISFVPGIQNLTATASLLPSLLEENYNAVPGEVTDGYLFGARAKLCDYSIAKEDGSEEQGIVATAIVNQSLYLVDVAFASDCSQEDGALILNVFSSMNVLTPTSVNQETKTATYESKYPEVTPLKTTQTTDVPVTEWVYLPYYYYDWDSDTDYTAYDSNYYQPDWDYYSNGNWWNWDWDDESDWQFYDAYSDYYDEDYYDNYADYYDDYNPYSDSGDYYDYYSDFGYTYDDYDVYSDPGDTYDDYDVYSDPGDTYDDYDVYSDPGDTYDDYDVYSDPGDTYDDYDVYSDPGDTYDEY
ncbi:MAG: hypothetical protein ACERKZ_03175 [Lachnotalea sp.]